MSTDTKTQWRWDDRTAIAEWSGGRAAARVELLQPQKGVRLEVRSEEVGIDRLNVLGVSLESPLDRQALGDAYTRVDDLIATYPQNSVRPHRIQLYWHRLKSPEPHVWEAIELQVLTQTDLLDSDPRRTSGSDLPAGEVLRLNDSALPAAKSLSISSSLPPQLAADDGLPCLLFRPTDRPWTYVEMVHPLDAHGDELHLVQDRLHLTHHLFGNWLEKGVILRSRLRGALIDRQEDVATAADLYRRLCNEPPPLTT